MMPPTYLLLGLQLDEKSALCSLLLATGSPDIGWKEADIRVTWPNDEDPEYHMD